MGRKAALLAGLLAAAWPGGAAADDLTAFTRARLAEGDRQVEAAARQYGLALAADPANADLAARTWRTAMLAGDLPLARRSAAALAAAGRTVPAEARILALADAIHGHDAAATDAALVAIGKGPFAFIAPIVRGWLALDAGGDPIRPLAVRQPESAERLYDENRALLLIAQGKIDEGAKALETLLSGSSGSLGLRYAAAELLAGRDQLPLARALLRGTDPAVATVRDHLRPVRASTAYGVSRLLSRIAGDLQDPRVANVAVSYCRAALVLDPGNDRARLLLANALSALGAHRAALAALDGVDAAGSMQSIAPTVRIAILSAGGDGEGALRAARALAEAPGAGEEPARIYGDLLMEAGRPADAARAYTLARDRSGADAAGWTIWFQIGAAQERAGRWDLARPALERAVELAPQQPLALNYLGYSLADRGIDLDRAIGLLERAHAAAPDQASIVDSLGWAYFRRGDRARALPLLEQAAQASPASGDISLHLGDAYWADGRFVEARYAWRAALAVADDGEARRTIETRLRDGPPRNR